MLRIGLTTLNHVLSPVALLTALPVSRGRQDLDTVGIGLFPAGPLDRRLSCGRRPCGAHHPAASG